MKQLYYIKFLDHAIGLRPPTCEVCAWFVKEDDDVITLSWWVTDLSGEDYAANLEEFVILKAAILEMYLIEI